jgi:thiamine phosphate synthase YjbQ (UPF0047 family)
MIQQIEISLTPKSRGFHLVTGEIMRQLPKLPKTGIIRSTSGRLLPTGRKNIFCKHTSCGLSINENADPGHLLGVQLRCRAVQATLRPP